MLIFSNRGRRVQCPSAECLKPSRTVRSAGNPGSMGGIFTRLWRIGLTAGLGPTSAARTNAHRLERRKAAEVFPAVPQNSDSIWRLSLTPGRLHPAPVYDQYLLNVLLRRSTLYSGLCPQV